MPANIFADVNNDNKIGPPELIYILQSVSGIRGAKIPLEVAFSTTVNISNSQEWSQAPDLSLGNDGGINTVWEESGGDLLFSRSIDGGNTFTAPKTLHPLFDRFDAEQMRIANSRDNIHVVWTIFDVAYRLAEVFYTNSFDRGQSFSYPIMLSTDDAVNSYNPAISTAELNKVGIVWSDSDINRVGGPSGVMFAHSADNGITFSKPLMIAPGDGGSAKIAMHANDIYIAWQQPQKDNIGTADILFAVSTDGGINFSSPIIISNRSKPSWWPIVKVDRGGNIYVVWAEGHLGTPEDTAPTKFLLSKSIDSGKTFCSPKIISYTNAYTEKITCYSFAIGADGEEYVAWSVNNSYHDGYFNYNNYSSSLVISLDQGATFTSPFKISVMGAYDACPQVISKGKYQFSLMWQGPMSDLRPGEEVIKPDILYSNGQISTQ